MPPLNLAFLTKVRVSFNPFSNVAACRYGAAPSLASWDARETHGIPAAWIPCVSLAAPGSHEGGGGPGMPCSTLRRLRSSVRGLGAGMTCGCHVASSVASNAACRMLDAAVEPGPAGEPRGCVLGAAPCSGPSVW
jgi:hypothetical protein